MVIRRCLVTGYEVLQHKGRSNAQNGGKYGNL